MMSKIEILLNSSAFWFALAVAVIEGLKVVLPSLNGNVALIVQFVIAVIATILHSKEIQVAGATGMLGSRSIRK